jgi:hypothetical protein
MKIDVKVLEAGHSLSELPYFLSQLPAGAFSAEVDTTGPATA